MRYLLALMATLALALPGTALAHAFPDNSSPHVGATVATSPQTVKIWFNSQIEPVFSTLIVKNAAGQSVGTDKGKVDAKNHELLETAITQPLPAGTYTVYWSVIAHDGHHTEGHFQFHVK